MDTLRRVGSIRKSMRKPKKPIVPQEPNIEAEPQIEDGQNQLQASYFTLTCTDAVVSAVQGFQPTHLRLIIARHRKTYTSTQVLWEPSLKSHLTGAGVWHPPFVVSVNVSPPLRSKSDGTLRHKDAFVSLENIDLKGKKKLLAKVRVNLSDYYVAASVSPVAFKLKLYSESSKVTAAHVHVSIHRTEQNPGNLTAPTQPEDDTVSNHSLHVPMTRNSSRSLSDEEIQKSPKKNNYLLDSPAMPRPSSLRLKHSITVEKPIPDLNRVDNNNEFKLTPPSSPEPESPDKDLKEISESTFRDDSYPFLDEESSLSAKDETNEDLTTAGSNFITPDKSRLLAQPEDFDILTPKKVVSGIVLPTGPPPPLPQRAIINLVTSSAPEPKTPPIVKVPEDVSPSIKIESPKEDKNLSPKKSSESMLGSPFKKPVTPVKKPKKQLNVDDYDSDDERPSSDSIRLIGCPSPRMTPQKQSTDEQDLLEWTKKSLVNYNQIKVTNLFSSWRNGLGFCALLHSKHPNLIPLNSLKGQNMSENCQLAFEAAELLGMDTSITQDNLSEKGGCVAFLKELRMILANLPPDDLPKTKVIEFQSRWYEKCGYFEKEVGHLFVVEELSPQPEPQEETSPDYAMNGGNEEDDESPNRDRVRDLIAAAHQDAAMSHVDDAVTRSRLRESKTINEEMAKLAMEEVRISKEKDDLERRLRSETSDSHTTDICLQKLMKLVNEKNSLVMRQMQLNIAEQEKVINSELEEIQWKLQKYTDMDESQKTEAVKKHEQALLDQLLEAVNKKNELVLHLDNQEKEIAENDRIQKLVESKDFVSLKKEEECVIQ